MKDKKVKYGYKIVRKSLSGDELVDYFISEKNLESIEQVISHAKCKLSNMDIHMKFTWYIVPFVYYKKDSQRYLLREIVCIENGKELKQTPKFDDNMIIFM